MVDTNIYNKSNTNLNALIYKCYLKEYYTILYKIHLVIVIMFGDNIDSRIYQASILILVD